MDFAQLLRRTWNIVWGHKFLILLGVLAALGSGGGMHTGAAGEGMQIDWPGVEWDVPRLPDIGQIALPAANIALVGLLMALALIVGLAVWVVATIARGGLIAGADAIEAGEPASFGAAWRAAWARGWRLLGISILPAVPAVLVVLVGLLSALSAGAVSALGVDLDLGSLRGLGGITTAVFCVAAPLSLLLGLLSTFANRACMLEGVGVLSAYRRGLTVLVENLGQAILLFLLQVLFVIAIGLLMILPVIVTALCCLAWPFWLLVQGTLTAAFSTAWTLAWRQWTGMAEA